MFVYAVVGEKAEAGGMIVHDVGAENWTLDVQRLNHLSSPPSFTKNKPGAGTCTHLLPALWERQRQVHLCIVRTSLFLTASSKPAKAAK